MEEWREDMGFICWCCLSQDDADDDVVVDVAADGTMVWWWYGTARNLFLDREREIHTSSFTINIYRTYAWNMVNGLDG